MTDRPSDSGLGVVGRAVQRIVRIMAPPMPDRWFRTEPPPPALLLDASGDDELPMEPLTAQVLKTLIDARLAEPTVAADRERFLPAEELFQSTWGSKSGRTIGNVYTHIRQIRRRLGDASIAYRHRRSNPARTAGFRFGLGLEAEGGARHESGAATSQGAVAETVAETRMFSPTAVVEGHKLASRFDDYLPPFLVDLTARLERLESIVTDIQTRAGNTSADRADAVLEVTDREFERASREEWGRGMTPADGDDSVRAIGELVCAGLSALERAVMVGAAHQTPHDEIARTMGMSVAAARAAIRSAVKKSLTSMQRLSPRARE